ncbi:MAG: EAL domain-containing protein [Desulforhopalus sp.]
MSILIISEETTVRKGLADFLGSKGFKVFAAATELEGIAHLKNCATRLVFISIGSQNGCGLKTISKIKLGYPSVAIIALISNATIESALEAMRQGVSSCLAKPYENDQVMFYIRWAIENKNADTLAIEKETNFAKLLEIAPDAILVLNQNQQILVVNSQFEEMFGYGRSEVLGKNLDILIPLRYSNHTKYVQGYILRPQKRLMGQGKEFFALRKDGSEFAVEIALSSLKTADEVRVIAIIRDISERISYEFQLEHQANHDSLTQLPNRNLLIDRLDRALLYAERHHSMVGVLCVDLDHFKRINDSLGHDVGDRLLQTAAIRFSDCIRSSDTVARQGGDDFVFVITDVGGEDNIAKMAQKILVTMDQPLKLDSHDLHVTCSIGISIFPKDGKDAQTLLKNADAAMYRAKESGRNTSRFFTYHLSNSLVTQMTMEKHLRHALVNEELSLLYQPQLDLASGRVIGAEALLRWQNPELGAISPVNFIPLAEETGLIISIGEWVLRTACQQNSRWQKSGLPPLTMAVNLSPRQFWNPGLIDTVTQILRESGLTPACLELEITESMVMRDKDYVAAMLTEFKEIGVKLSIDDFGTGYSSLNQLRSFPFDKLKMDISFVREITYDPGSAAIAKTIISLAHNLNLLVIAEGVETEAQLNYLRNQGCDEMQGYLFSKPISADDFAKIIKEDRHLCILRDDEPHLKTILILDDDQLNIDIITRVLKSENYHILSANSADEGFEILALNQVDVILSDQRMPGMTGIEFLKRVKNLYPDTVRIAMSGYADAEMVVSALNQSGIYKFLQRPFDSELLLQTLQEAFALIA